MKVKKGGEGSWLCEYNETGNSPILGIQLRDEKGRNDEIRVGSEVYSFLIIFILDFKRKKAANTIIHASSRPNHKYTRG